MKNVLILGANSDIAQAIAYEFARNKFSITLAARNVKRLEPLQSDLHLRHQVSVDIVEFDALNFKGHAAFYADLGRKPDIAICVFGYLGEQKKAETTWEESEKIISTNYTGAVSILNVVAQDMEQRKDGCIVGISSVAGDRGRQSNFIYGSAKAAFSTYLAGLRNRLYKNNVHVLTVKPGFVRTRMTAGLPLPKPVTATPAQVARSVFKAVKHRCNVIYTLWMWRYIMLIIRNVPEFVFKRMKM